MRKIRLRIAIEGDDMLFDLNVSYVYPLVEGWSLQWQVPR